MTNKQEKNKAVCPSCHIITWCAAVVSVLYSYLPVAGVVCVFVFCFFLPSMYQVLLIPGMRVFQPAGLLTIMVQSVCPMCLHFLVANVYGFRSSYSSIPTRYKYLG